MWCSLYQSDNSFNVINNKMINYTNFFEPLEEERAFRKMQDMVYRGGTASIPLSGQGTASVGPVPDACSFLGTSLLWADSRSLVSCVLLFSCQGCGAVGQGTST